MDESDLENNISVVILRPYDMINDEALIYATWRNGSYYGSKKYNEIKRMLRQNELTPQEERKIRHEHFRTQTIKIRKVLEGAQIRIACLKEAPSIIVGYSVSTGNNLNWIFVKADYQRKGIGKLLMPKDIETVDNTDSKVGHTIIEKKNLKIKGETNDNDRDESRQTNQRIQICHNDS